MPFHLRDHNRLMGLSGPSWCDPRRALHSHVAGRNGKRVEMKRGRGSKHSSPSHRSLVLSPWDACPYIKMWFGALAGNTARRGWMRGIGFTVQTTEPQSLLLQHCTHSCWRVRCLCMCCIFGRRGWVGGWLRRGCVVVEGRSQDPFYRLQEVRGWNESLHIAEVQFEQCV